jgi:hypothetical protein
MTVYKQQNFCGTEIEENYGMAHSISSELLHFVAAAKEKGASDETLLGILENEGWARADIWTALGRHFETANGVKIPPGRKTTTPAKDAFFYLLAFSTLATWTISLGSICFTLIDAWFPDPLARYGYLRWASWQISSELATMIVTFPIYLLVMRLIVSDTRQAPEKLESGVRKWLTYIALLITAGVMIGDIITFLTYFLRGEVTSRFVGKVVVTLLISGGVFWYYLGSLRDPKAKLNANQ